MIAWQWLVGCGSGSLLAPGGPDGPTPTDPVPTLAVVVDGPAAFDPLQGPTSLTITTSPAAHLAVEIRASGAAVWQADAEADAEGQIVVQWDGREGTAFAPAGRYEVDVVATLDGLEAIGGLDFGVVRPGFVAARLEGDGGVSALREPLFWPVQNRLQDEADPLVSLAEIDDGAAPLDFPTVPPGTMALPPVEGEPAAFVFDSRPVLRLDVASSSVALGETGLDVTDVAVEVDGWTVLSGSPIRPGAEVVLQADEPLGDTVGVSALTLELRFLVDGDPIGAQALPLRIYRLLDVSGFSRAEAAYRPWAPVVEQALVVIDGTPAEFDPVLDALVGFVYADLGLTYDTQSGASAYSSYVGFDWDRPHFQLSDFLVRRFGNVINCSDAGNILGAYANMVGAPLYHLIIDPPFDLNYIQAVGGTSFTSCPFGPWGCGFSYHAVTTSTDASTIWDATLALDGDVDPGSLPAAELLVQSIASDEYLDRLVRSGWPTYHDAAQETLE